MSDRRTFGEPVTVGFEHVFLGDVLYSGHSDVQKIEVYEHERFGRVLTLDDTIQTTENDEFCYHEMLVHPALCARERVERVLIIGGGDGGTLRHVLMHDPVEAVMCEIDGEVVRVCRELMPALAGEAFTDPRGRVVIGDGAAFVAEHEDVFDAVIVDSTDPVGAAVVLFSTDFYEACLRALKPDGVFVSQTGSPMYQGPELQRALGNMRSVFSTVETYLGFVPTYPGVVWSYTSATAGQPISATEPGVIGSRLELRNIATKFYSPASHVSSFVLPPFIRESIAASAPASVPVR